VSHEHVYVLFSLLALWSAWRLWLGTQRRRRRRAYRRALRRGGYVTLTASRGTSRTGRSTTRRTRRSAASSNSPTGRGGQSAVLEILPLRPEQSRSTGGTCSGNETDGGHGRPRRSAVSNVVAVVGFAEPDGTTSVTEITDDEAVAAAYGRYLRRLFPDAWKPEYGTEPAWLPSDELVSNDGHTWRPEDAA
jgi:hypothetical protein